MIVFAGALIHSKGCHRRLAEKAEDVEMFMREEGRVSAYHMANGTRDLRALRSKGSERTRAQSLMDHVALCSCLSLELARIMVSAATASTAKYSSATLPTIARSKVCAIRLMIMKGSWLTCPPMPSIRDRQRHATIASLT